MAVVDGKVVVEGEPLRDGTKVMVVVENDRGAALSPEQKALLLESARQAEHGKVVDGWALLRENTPGR